MTEKHLDEWLYRNIIWSQNEIYRDHTNKKNRDVLEYEIRIIIYRIRYKMIK